MSELDPVEVTIKENEPIIIKEVDLGETPAAEKVGTKQEQITNNEGVELLRRQLEEKRREAELAKQQKAESDYIAQQRAHEVKTYQVHAQDNQLMAFTNAIASYERDAEMLERDYASTLQEGDYSKAAKLQRQMSQIETRLTQLAQGREALQERLTVEKQQLRNAPQPQMQRPPMDPFEAKIANLSETSKNWIRQRPEVITDPKINAVMTAAHYETVAEGIPAESPEYFSYIENRVYNQPRQTTSNQTRNYRASMAAAPVSRSSSPSFRSNGEIQMTLTPEMREIAEMNGMTDEEYARNRLYYMNKGEIRG